MPEALACSVAAPSESEEGLKSSNLLPSASTCLWYLGVPRSFPPIGSNCYHVWVTNMPGPDRKLAVKAPVTPSRSRRK